MNPHQNVPKREQSDQGSYCLQYRLPMKIGKQEGADDKKA